MALQVWFPLIRENEFENQGLADVTLENYGLTYDSSALLGGCYVGDYTAKPYMYFYMTGSKSTSDQDFMDEYINGKSFSVAAWMKGSSQSAALSLTNGITLDNNLFRMFNNSSPVTINRQLSNSISTVDGEWHHVCGTYDTSTGNMRFYVDGSLGTTTASAATVLGGYEYNPGNGWTKMQIGRDTNNTTQGSYLNDRVCDVRVYDECLSQKEVSELAKGLVVHMPMDMTFQEGNMFDLNSRVWTSGSNTYTSSNAPASPCENVSESAIYASFANNGYRHNGLSYMRQAVDDGIYFYKVDGENTFVCGNTSSASFWYWPTVPVKVEPNTGYCLSYVQTNSGGGTYDGWANIMQYDQNCLFTSNREVNSGNTSAVGSDGRKRIYFMTNYNCKWVFLHFGAQYAGNVMTYQNITLTKSETVPDCAGYGYGGYLCNYDGATFVSSTLPSNPCRYQNYLTTPGTNTAYVQCSNLYFLTSKMTVSFWLNTTQTPTASSVYIGQGRDYGYYGWEYRHWTNGKIELTFGGNVDNSGETCYLISTSAVNDGSWHHIAHTWDGSNVKLYIDGALDVSGTASTISYDQGPILTIGKMSYYYYQLNQFYPSAASFSDLRIYATALTADDIKRLYSVAGCIDDRGNMLCYQFNETTKNAVQQTGLIDASTFVQNSAKNLYDFDVLAASTGKSSAMTVDADAHTITITNSYSTTTGKKLSELCPGLQVGDTFIISGIPTQADGTEADRHFIWLLGYGSTIQFNTPTVCTQAMLDSTVYHYGIDSGVVTISNFQIELGNAKTQYVPHGGDLNAQIYAGEACANDFVEL